MGKTTKEKKPASPKKTTQKKTKKTSKSAKKSLSLAQRAFLQCYSDMFGNITAACKKTGVSRQTFYNWRDSNESFAAEIEGARVNERLVEAAEIALLKRLEENDMKAIIYVLDSKGASRGWGRNATLNVATKTPIVIQPADVGFFDHLKRDENNEN